MTMLPSFYLDAVVAIELMEVDEEDSPSYRPVGSGVLVGRPMTSEQDPSDPPYGVYLVTNRHIVDAARDESLYIKLNVGGHAERFRIGRYDTDGSSLWYFYEHYDIAVTYIADEQLAEADADYTFIPEHAWLAASEMDDYGVGEGDDLFVCGFPMGLAGRERKYSIVRSGMLARVDADIIAETNSFLIDCSIFPGNSGGPVFLRTGPRIEDGEIVYGSPLLIGVVQSYLPYEDVAVSLQTRRPRVTFEENSGLASVVPMEAVLGACVACAQGPTVEQHPVGGDEDVRIASHAIRMPRSE